MNLVAQPESSGHTSPPATSLGSAVRPEQTAGHLAFLLALLTLFVWLTRWPLFPPHLYSFDSVNLALALGEFDPTHNQPQPPGYPLFVVEARALYPLLGTPERTFKVIQFLVSALAVALLYLLAGRMISATVGCYAAVLLMVNPVFWYSGVTSPLRPHLALFTILIALCCWRALEGERRFFHYATVALAAGSGFRPELGVILLPLWLWVGWKCGGVRLLAAGAALGGALSWLWLANLAMASGGFSHMLQAFREYAATQTFQTAALGGTFSPGWRRMAGRVFVWSVLGALPWFWALPWGWWRRGSWPGRRQGLIFLAVWTGPALLFYLIFHSADPDHLLPVIPAICLLGAFCVRMAEEALQARGKAPAATSRWRRAIWPPLLFLLLFLFPQEHFPGPEVAIWGAMVLALHFVTPDGFRGVRSSLLAATLLGNIYLFTGQFPFPQGPAGGAFRGLASVRDAFLAGIYETSLNRVRWTADRMIYAYEEMTRLQATHPGPVVLIWGRDGEPVWRKLTYYFPWAKVYVLDEAGDPGVRFSQARLWLSHRPLERYQGEAPIRVPVPKGSRLVWFLGGGRVTDLAQVVPLKKTLSLVYTDLPEDASGFRWGSFEFVPEGGSLLYPPKL